MEDRENLKEDFFQACEGERLDVARDIFFRIEKQLTYPILQPERLSPEESKTLSVDEIDEYLCLLKPFLWSHFHRQEFGTAALCCSVILMWMEFKPECARDEHYWRLDCAIRHARLRCYKEPIIAATPDEIEITCKLAIYSGEKIKTKTQEDLNLLLSAFRNLSEVYCYRKFRDNGELYRIVGRVVEVYGQIHERKEENLRMLIDTCKNFGQGNYSKIFLAYVDQHRAELLKYLSKRLDRFKAEKNHDELKRCFIEMDDLINTFYDIDVFRRTHPAIKQILIQRWIFVYEQPEYIQAFEFAGAVEKLQKIFKAACEKKAIKEAFEASQEIAKELGIELFSPCKAIGHSKVEFMLIHELLRGLVGGSILLKQIFLH